MVDLSRFLLLLVPALFVYLAAARLLLGWVHRRLRGLPEPERPVRTRRFRRAVAGFAIVGLLLLAWAHVEPYWPEVTRVRIERPDLAGGRPFRIVQIGDLHSDPAPRLEERLPEIVLGLDPDAVVFTGDAINSREGLPVFRACMRRIAARVPVFGVKGNWEAWWFEGIDVFEGTGVRELDGDAACVRAGGNAVWFAGAAVEGDARIEAALERVPADACCVFLHHYPCAWRLAEPRGADLHLAGDTHGGQIVLPLLGPLVRIARYDGAFYPSGLHRKGRMLLYVNRGIGMEGGHVPRVRFLCRPEITLIELVPAAGGDRN